LTTAKAVWDCFQLMPTIPPPLLHSKRSKLTDGPITVC